MRVTTLLAAACLALAAAGCGGGSSGSGTTATVAKNATPAQQKAAIRRIWTAFFSSDTPPQQRAMYLQNGAKFEEAIREQSKSPLAKNVSATVQGVTLHGPARATVRYSIDLAGKPALKNETGTAVKVNGLWQVGDDSFCKLLGLGGKVPAGCKNVG